jgi:Flp pilus assembly protein TadG
VAAVELAVMAPFLGLLFMITVDFARVFYYQTVLDNCARNGALLGAQLNSYQETGWVIPDNTVAAAAAADGASLNPPLTASQVTVNPKSGTALSGYPKGSDGNPQVTVTINYTFTTLTQFPGFANSFNLTAVAKMRVADQ